MIFRLVTHGVKRQSTLCTTCHKDYISATTMAEFELFPRFDLLLFWQDSATKSNCYFKSNGIVSSSRPWSANYGDYYIFIDFVATFQLCFKIPFSRLNFCGEMCGYWTFPKGMSSVKQGIPGCLPIFAQKVWIV